MYGLLLLSPDCCTDEVQLLKKKDIENQEKFQRKYLKQIHGLPDNASSSACMVLLGILPLEAVLHKTLLNMFVNITKNPKSVEFEIAKRQLVIRESSQKSMFTHIQGIL